jgi:preprotein translocase subunit SecF
MLWMKYRLVYFLLSTILLVSGIFGLVRWGLNLGIDFTGGVVAEYKVVTDKSADGNIKSYKYPPMSDEEIEKIRTELKQTGEELRFETVGPSIGPELVEKTVYALAISALLILFWVTIQFKSLKFGVSAILAMLHDSIILIGGFSILGHFFAAEVDFLFVTAVLTILSFSVHDTIVVFDRIREKQKKEGGELTDTVNSAITETMTRSLNNSFTIIFMLLSLVLLGGDTIKWFAIALLIGTISGTYSSPFVAVPILVTWDNLQKKLKK